MRTDQAIYTSLQRSGKDGYHLVSRSPGVSDADARALTAWSPSHGALIVDEANHVSVNIHPLSEGRLAISRTCEGPPEYSGRGGRQIYTHALLFDVTILSRAHLHPFSLFRDAMAMGILHYRPAPPPMLDEVELGRCHSVTGMLDRFAGTLEIRPEELADHKSRLLRGDRLELRHSGDRLRFAESLLNALPGDLVASLSLSTSLQPSSTRPFHICLTP